MSFHPRTTYIIWIFLQLARSGWSLQYCYEDASVPVHFCVAIEERHNTTSASTDLLVTFGHQRFSPNGWVGIGLGGGMAGAVMFIAYLSGKEQEPVLTIRQGKGHFQPLPVEGNPAIEINRLSKNSTNWLEASLTYLSYGPSDAQSDVANEQDSWKRFIWSANPWDFMASAEATLTMHVTYGHFALERRQASASTAQTSAFPVIDFSRKNDGVEGDGRGSNSTLQVSWSSLIFQIHGYLLTLATILIFPAGAVYISSGAIHAFRVHVWLQAIAASMCLIGLILGISTIIYSAAWHRLREPHVILGGSIFALVCLQGFLGRAHHRAYKARRVRSNLTSMHRALGRLLPIFCYGNVVLGLLLAGNSSSSIKLVSFVGGCNVIVAVALWYRTYAKESRFTAKEEGEFSIALLESHT